MSGYWKAKWRTTQWEEERRFPRGLRTRYVVEGLRVNMGDPYGLSPDWRVGANKCKKRGRSDSHTEVGVGHISYEVG